ncbi:MAG: peptidoglycan DD-metalloendopeptidase family protein [Mariprofundaceae bacterium]|nr:peptidoglycan DD-metalloendopeptidase family protein [Mariprofundaceae bacterium]
MKSFVLLFLLLWVLSANAWAASSAQLNDVKQQQVKLKRSQAVLSSQLKSIGRQVERLDSALVGLNQEKRTFRQQISQLNRQLSEIKKESYGREQALKILRERIGEEAKGAYQHANMQSSWIRSPLKVVDLPHRKYMLQKLILQQQQDVAQHQTLLQDLLILKESQQQKHLALHQAKASKDANIKKLRAKRKEKKRLWSKVDKDKNLKKAKLAALKRHERQLRQLIVKVHKKRRTDKKFKKLKRKGNLKWPLKGKVMVRFAAKAAAGQPKLSGVQIAPTTSDRNVHVIADGQVSYAQFFTSYGLMMIVDHGHGLMSVYAHNQVLHKKVGDSVKKGEVLAQAGSTGWVRNTRLYFEIRKKGKPSNPELWCR